MYLPRISYSSPSDFGSITSPLDHGTAAGRRLAEYRSPCDHEPRQPCRPPWEWTFYQANRPITSSSPPCFNLDAAQQSLRPSFNASDGFLYGPSGFQRGFSGDPRRHLDRYPAFSPDSQLLVPVGRNRVLPPVFDQFFDYAEKGDLMTGDVPTEGGQQRKHTEWGSCHSGESREVRAGKDSPRAEEEDGEAPSTRDCGDNQAPGESSRAYFEGKALRKKEKKMPLLQAADQRAGEGVPVQRLRQQGQTFAAVSPSLSDGSTGENLVPEQKDEREEAEKRTDAVLRRLPLL